MKLRMSLMVCLLLMSSMVVVAADDKVNIGYVYAMANSPLIVADKKGLFSKEGVEANVIKFTSGPILYKAIVAKDLDIAYVGFPPTYHWHAKGLPITVLSKVNYGQHAILVKKGSGIKSLKDLKGKRIAGVKKGSGTDVLLRGYVIQKLAGLDPDKDMTVIQTKPANMGQALATNQVDAAFTWEPFTTKYLLSGEYEIIFNLLDEQPKYPWYVVAVRNEFLSNNRELVKKVLKAHEGAIAVLNSGDTNINKTIAAAFKIRNFKTADGRVINAEDVVARARERVGFSSSITDQDIEFFKSLMKYSKRLRFLRKSMQPSDLLDTSLMEEISLNMGTDTGLAKQ